jgi:hypothetical protein
VLIETPEPNLVAGMKWFLGVYSQGWNRRRQRHGHVFQGRYKAVVVNAALIRKRTGVSNRWIAGRLGMGQESSVIRAVRRTKEYAGEAERMLDLENRLPADYRDWYLSRPYRRT